MLILRGRSNRMSATPNGSVLRLTRACLSLASAAVTLSLSPLHAMPRRAPAPRAHPVATARAQVTSHSAAKHVAGHAPAAASAVRPVNVSNHSPKAAVPPAGRMHLAARGEAKGERYPVHSSAHIVTEAPVGTRRASGSLQALAGHQAASVMPSRATLSAVKTAPAAKAVGEQDHAAEERVRAWYQARAAAEFAATAPVVTAPAAKPAPAAKAPPVAIAPVPVVVTTAVNSSTEDDAAAIHEESRIPGTAPTERVPVPFTHGDLLAGVPSVPTTASRPHVSAPASLAGSVPPVLHGPAPAAQAVASLSAKPKLDPEFANTMAREALDDSDAVGLSNRSATALVGSTANIKLAERPALAVLSQAPALQSDPFASEKLIAPMRGTHIILVHQNQMAVADGLLRVSNDKQMADMQRHKLLVALPDTQSIQPDGRLPLNRRYARPWTVQFLSDLAQAHYARFHTPLVITSAVRTVAFQRHLVQVNGNAAPPTGDVASPHLYGQAVDLAKHGMSITEIAWLRAYLTPIESDGKIDVEEEFLQSCFHISVYRRYAPQPVQRETPAVEEAPSRRVQQARATPARRRHISTALLAAGLR